MSLIRSISKCSNWLKSIKIVSISEQSLKSNQNQIFRRNFHLSQIHQESSLAKLRKKTGYAFALCRKALEQNDQDVAKAEKWLRAEAAKQGWEKAERVKSRTTGQGLIGIYTSPDYKTATMVEVKCETDFVARNENFVKLVSELAKSLANQTDQSQSSNSSDPVTKNWVTEESKLNDIGGKLVIETIQKLGENIRFVRGCIVNIVQDDSPIRLMPYAHAVAGKIESNDKQILLGKYGTIVALIQNQQQSQNESSEEIDTTQVSTNIEEIGSRLGQHIIGLSPKTVNKKEQSEQNENPVNPENEEPEELLKQKFIFNEEITVEIFLKNSNAQVLDFVRFECGEDTSKQD